jgi:hypothetical protein
LPEEEKNDLDKTLTQAITEDIANSHRFNLARCYEIEVPYEGKQGGGIPHEFWIWIATGAAYVGEKLLNAVIDKATEKVGERAVKEAEKMVDNVTRSQDSGNNAGKIKIVEKVASLIEEIREILKKERYRQCQARIKVQSLHTGRDINEEGLLVDTLDRIVAILKDRAKGLEEGSPDRHQPKIGREIEVSISIKVSHKSEKRHA